MNRLILPSKTLKDIAMYIASTEASDDPFYLSRKEEVERIVNGVFNGVIYNPVIFEMLKSIEIDLDDTDIKTIGAYMLPATGLVMIEY